MRDPVLPIPLHGDVVTDAPDVSAPTNTAGQAQLVTDHSIGGYRLVRKLGEGVRAEVHLAYPEHDGADAGAVAIKVYRPEVPPESVVVEVEALSRAAGDHVLRVLDLAGGPHSPALIMERLGGGSLGRLLRDRGSLRTGEAITVLAPLARTISRLHESGVIHGSVRLEAVAFDDVGAPVLLGFGAARLIEPGLPPARLEQEPGVVADHDAFARLARAVLDRLPVPIELPEPGPEWLDRVVEQLFSLGSPEPVRLEADASPLEYPGRMLTSPAVVAEPDARGVGSLAVSGALEWLDLPAARERVAHLLASLRATAASVRRRVWVAAGAVLVALVLALTVIPQHSRDVPAEAAPSASADPRPQPSDDALAGDDPLAALPELLAERERCIRDLSVLCLDGVDQQGSAALADDQTLIRGLQDGAELPLPFTVVRGELTVEERLGDSALVAVGEPADSEPASILMMRSEVGWRIRDYLER